MHTENVQMTEKKKKKMKMMKMKMNAAVKKMNEFRENFRACGLCVR